ncbi:MAG: hypothetical protein AVDCRST_MAG19-4905, partial [uncultured Thermomicrobiales bacterium]
CEREGRTPPPKVGDGAVAWPTPSCRPSHRVRTVRSLVTMLSMITSCVERD